MKTNLNIHALVKSPIDETLVIQSNTTNANIKVPRTIQWSDIQLPTSWLSKNESYQQKCKLILKLNGKKNDDSTVSSSPPPLETILSVYEEFTITTFPFKLPGEHPAFEKIIGIMFILITN